MDWVRLIRAVAIVALMFGAVIIFVDGMDRLGCRFGHEKVRDWFIRTIFCAGGATVLVGMTYTLLGRP